MNTLKVVLAMVVLAAVAWMVWSVSFAEAANEEVESTPTLRVVDTPRPTRTRAVELLEPEPVPEEPVAKPSGDDKPKRGRGREAPKSNVNPDAGTTADANAQQRANTVSGLVVDVYGAPVDAHVTAVTSGGSVSMSTRRGSDDVKGQFSLEKLRGAEFTIQATTSDGRIGVQSGVRLDSQSGAGGLTLTVEEGAKLSLLLSGAQDKVRCSIVSNGVLIDDFTLNKGKAAKEVVPAGPVLVTLYTEKDGNRTVHDERSLSLAPGEEHEEKLDLP